MSLRHVVTSLLAASILVGLAVLVVSVRPSPSSQPAADSTTRSPEPSVPRTGCGAAERPVFDDTSFTPYETRFGYGPRLTIRERGEPLRELSDYRVDGHTAVMLNSAPGGRTLRLAMAGNDGGLALLLSAVAVRLDATLEDFWATGGIVLGQRPGTGHDAESVVADVGGRAVVVLIGPHPAALVHADPVDVDGTRTYNLYWSDGRLDLSLIGNAQPETIIELARTLYCG